MSKTFVLKETREFRAYNRSEVIDACHSQNVFIVTELCKLTYLTDLLDRQHWIDNLCGAITKNAKDNFKKGNKVQFSYGWFFEMIGAFEDSDAERIYEQLPKRYDKVKPKNVDFEVLASNVNIFRRRLDESYYRKGSLLTKKEIESIINDLDLYKE